MRVLHLPLCLLLAAAAFAQEAKPLPEQKPKRETLAEAIAFERFKETVGKRQAQLDAAGKAAAPRKSAPAKKDPPTRK